VVQFTYCFVKVLTLKTRVVNCHFHEFDVIEIITVIIIIIIISIIIVEIILHFMCVILFTGAWGSVVVKALRY
jgi:hypothetical protein